jgi:hypothetical protein
VAEVLAEGREDEGLMIREHGPDTLRVDRTVVTRLDVAGQAVIRD